MIKFCSECGTKVEYKFSPPKFCSQCGAPMGVATVNESKPINRNVTSMRKAKALSEDETDSTSVPDIGKLEYEIEDYGSNTQQTIGSLRGEAAPKRRKIVRRDINDL